MPYARYSAGEVTRRGESMYQQRIRAQLDETQEKGNFLVLDIETGEYELDASDLEATKRALARRPDAVLYGLRIGYLTAYRLAGRFAAAPR